MHGGLARGGLWPVTCLYAVARDMRDATRRDVLASRVWGYPSFSVGHFQANYDAHELTLTTSLNSVQYPKSIICLSELKVIDLPHGFRQGTCSSCPYSQSLARLCFESFNNQLSKLDS